MRASLIACGIAGIGLVLLALAGPSYRIGLPLGFGFGLLRYGAYVGLAAALVAIGTARLAVEAVACRGGRARSSAPWWG